MPALASLHVDNLACLGASPSASCATVVAALTMPSRAVSKYGSPATAFVSLSSPDGVTLNMELSYLDKTPTMLGESIMFTFNPAPVSAWLGGVCVWGEGSVFGLVVVCVREEGA